MKESFKWTGVVEKVISHEICRLLADRRPGMNFHTKYVMCIGRPHSKFLSSQSTDRDFYLVPNKEVLEGPIHSTLCQSKGVFSHT